MSQSPFPREEQFTADRLPEGAGEPAGSASEAGTAKFLILGFGGLALLSLFVATRVADVFGPDIITAAALVWPAFVIAGTVLVIALWHRRTLGWAWLAGATVPWLALTGVLTAEALR